MKKSLVKLRDYFLSAAIGLAGGYEAMDIIGGFMDVPTQSYTDIYNAFAQGGVYEAGVAVAAIAVGIGVMASAYPVCMKKIFGR